MKIDTFGNYNSQFQDFENQHYLSTIIQTTERDMYDKKLSEKIVHICDENIKKRALEISKSNTCEKLYDLFVSCGLVDEKSRDLHADN